MLPSTATSIVMSIEMWIAKRSAQQFRPQSPEQFLAKPHLAPLPLPPGPLPPRSNPRPLPQERLRLQSEPRSHSALQCHSAPQPFRPHSRPFRPQRSSVARHHYPYP